MVLFCWRKRPETHEGEFDKLRPAFMRATRLEARMMRCEHCGGHAIPGLAHLHGNPCRHLCPTCTRRELERQELARKVEATKQEKPELCSVCVKRYVPRAA